MKKFIASMLVLCTFFGCMTISKAQALRFSDVPQGHWAYEAIEEMSVRGILSGFPDGTFRPDDFVTREQFAKMMVLALGIELTTPKKASFEDVGEKDWSYAYIETAKPYLTGYKKADTFYFKGKDYAVREDMAVALVTALKLENATYDLKELDTLFKDVDNISSDLRKHILIAYKNDLISGYKDHTFRANGIITRAEASSLLLKVSKSETVNKVALKDHQKLENTDSNEQSKPIIPECTDKDGNTCAPYSFSFTTTDKEINNYYDDGIIRFKYPSQFELEERESEGG